MGVKIVVGEREPISLALQRFRKLLDEGNGVTYNSKRNRWFIKGFEIRRENEFRTHRAKLQSKRARSQ